MKAYSELPGLPREFRVDVLKPIVVISFCDHRLRVNHRCREAALDLAFRAQPTRQSGLVPIVIALWYSD